MNAQTRALIDEAAQGSNQGRLHFGQVIGLLVQAGVEAYSVDYRARRSTYYLPEGATLYRGEKIRQFALCCQRVFLQEIMELAAYGEPLCLDQTRPNR